MKKMVTIKDKAPVYSRLFGIRRTGRQRQRA